MSNPDQNTSKPVNAESAAKLSAKIKETYSKLNDDDIKLYDGKRDQFFAKLKEKHSVSREEGEKKMQEVEKSCGCSPSAGTIKAA
ncbi:MAG: hypothetical protein WC043_03015 [Pseudobdellovibrionaceae bacterium]